MRLWRKVQIFAVVLLAETCVFTFTLPASEIKDSKSVSQEGAAAVSSGAAVSRPELRLPERISASDLKRLILDLPGTFDLVDIRPPQQFADYALPGSINVDIVELMSNPVYLTGVGPLIIADRDGSLAMAVAGILSQKTQRVIKALHGGVEAYWAESELRNAVGGRGAPGVTGVLPGTGRAIEAPQILKGGIPSIEGGAIKPAAPSQPAPPAPQRPKSTSAGC